MGKFYMRKRHKLPKASPKEVNALTLAAQIAYGDQAADRFFNEAMAVARRIRDEEFAADQQARTE